MPPELRPKGSTVYARFLVDQPPGRAMLSDIAATQWVPRFLPFLGATPCQSEQWSTSFSNGAAGREAGNGSWVCLKAHPHRRRDLLGDSRDDGNGRSDQRESHTPMAAPLSYAERLRAVAVVAKRRGG